MLKRLTLILALATAPVSAPAQPIRSAAPIFTDMIELWPRQFFNEGVFGCSSPMRSGDYVARPNDPEASEAWWRIDFYGAVHCGHVIAVAYGQVELRRAPRDFAWLSSLGTTAGPTGPIELFAVQMGQQGSNYHLLARPDGESGESWWLLEAKCLPPNLRRVESVDIWVASYCEVEDADDLLHMAREAVQEANWTKLERVGSSLPRQPIIPDEVDDFLVRGRACRELEFEPPTEARAAEDYQSFRCDRLPDDGDRLRRLFADRSEVIMLIDAVVSGAGD